MRCEECRELIWDIDNEDLADDQRRSVWTHCNECPDCAEELEEVREVQVALRGARRINIESRTKSVLNKVYDQIEREQPKTASILSWRPLAGYLATAAVALFAIITLAPNETTALTIDKLTTKHRICITEGHHKNYRCNTEAAFAELTMNELGFTARPFEAPAGTFKKGDICHISGNKVAHALLDINGETVSYFRLFDISENVKKDGNWVLYSENVWSMKRQGHLVVLRQFDQGDFDLYTGKVTITDLKQILRQASP